MSESLYVRRKKDKNNLSSDDEGMDADHVWDDSFLIKAYDRAIDLAKENVARKISQENGLDEGKSKDLKPTPSKKPGKPGTSKPPKDQWKEGMACRAVFNEDGVEYEATIKNICRRKDTCTVVYVGYNNEEEIDISALKSSHGEAARKAQEIDSCHTMNSNVGNTDANSNHQPPDIPIPQPAYDFHGIGSSSYDIIPPPPPPKVMAHFPKDEADALSAMLMAWYMSGYHTGYYQGLTRPRSSRGPREGYAKHTSRLN